MRSPRLVPQQVLDTLSAGGTVLCANARAARALSQLYGTRVAAQGRRAWETPRIFDWQQWLHTQWQQLLLTGLEQRTLLSSLQEEVLWNEIVQPTILERSLIAPAEVARLAMRAYALLVEYNAIRRLQQGPWDHAALEPELFRRWALEMERRCDRAQWLCAASLPWVVANAISTRILAAPPAVAWNGFDRLTPVDDELRQALEQAGCRQTEVRWEMKAEQKLIAAPSNQDELLACAEWARDQLSADQLSANPGKTIGILLPEVESRRAELDRVFRNVLTPDAAGLDGAVNGSDTTTAYEFTLGLPLADVPMITAAVALLRWSVQPLDQQTITWILTSGFFGAPDQAATLAEADVRMRKKLTVPELEMEDALQRLVRFGSHRGADWTVVNWVRDMRRARDLLLPALGKQASCTQWVSTITQVLKKAGWPGDRALDSIGYQAIERWQRVLDEVSALGFVSGSQERRYNYEDFLGILQTQLRATVFSPESQGAPITISGIFESAGRSFDAVWVMGATDEAWPASSRQNMLLPAWLQHEYEMPGSSAEQDRALAEAAYESLRDCTGELVFSYSREAKEGEQRPSSLLHDLQQDEAATFTTKAPSLVESFVDEMLIAWPGGRAAGGQDVLKAQSACPFQAFAGKRFGARDLPELQPGLTAVDRGIVVHAVLHSFWADQRDSIQLRTAIMNGTLGTIIKKIVTEAFREYETIASTAWERDYLQLEQERVCALIERWLHYENNRRSFQVELLEQKETVFIDGLELSVRMDRIDRVEEGCVLIDYKTGSIKADAWNGERLAEPQLPIYATSGKVDQLHDVLFAKVRKDDFKYISAVFGKNSDLFPQASATPIGDIRELQAEWTTSMNALSREFQEGIATVTPKDYPSTCKHCSFAGLCRVAETQADTTEDDDPGADEA